MKKRLTITLDDDVHKALIQYIGRFMIENRRLKTMTEAVNELLRRALFVKEA